VVAASGGDPTLVVPRDQPGAIVDAPVWSPDGQSIYYAYQGVASGRPVARVEKVALADGTRQPLIMDGAFPTISPDGRTLAFVYDDGQGFSLRVGSTDGGDAREIVPSTTFVALAGPRFSPDGSRIAFAALSPKGPSGAPLLPSGPSPAPVGQRLVDFLTGAGVAQAHGDPWGIWLVRPDGSELRTATPLLEDEPLVAWSPDGASLAVHGGFGLWIVDLSGATDPRRIAEGAIGPIGW
jgi:Tol biopolymer transport system component